MIFRRENSFEVMLFGSDLRDGCDELSMMVFSSRETLDKKIEELSEVLGLYESCVILLEPQNSMNTARIFCFKKGILCDYLTVEAVLASAAVLSGYGEDLLSSYALSVVLECYGREDYVASVRKSQSRIHVVFEIPALNLCIESKNNSKKDSIAIIWKGIYYKLIPLDDLTINNRLFLPDSDGAIPFYYIWDKKDKNSFVYYCSSSVDYAVGAILLSFVYATLFKSYDGWDTFEVVERRVSFDEKLSLMMQDFLIVVTIVLEKEIVYQIDIGARVNVKKHFLVC